MSLVISLWIVVILAPRRELCETSDEAGSAAASRLRMAVDPARLECRICHNKGTPIVKVLLAVDHSDLSRDAVAFVGKVLGKSQIPGLEITIFHVVESLPEFILSRSRQGESSGAFTKVAEEWVESNRATGEKLLGETQESLAAAGIPKSQIQTKLMEKESRPEARRVIAALGIIEEMQQGSYDVIVVGRRGTSRAFETFLGSVAEKVAREAHGKTLWIVD
jgi:nucleotide-binding universal stress UspA family protein